MKSLSFTTELVLSAGLLAASAASADITISVSNQTFAGFNFNQIMNFAAGQKALGTLTALSINMTLNASTNFTYADDICIYVDPLPLSTGGRLQVGGFSNLHAVQRLAWPNGGSSTPGTVVTGTVSLTTVLPFFGNHAVDGVIWIGNGYGASGTSGTWSGTITLHGLCDWWDWDCEHGCFGDLIVDDHVNGADLGALLACWGPTTSSGASQRADLNRDGAVDGIDLGYLLSSWGQCTD
jgi:hypothetical protein